MRPGSLPRWGGFFPYCGLPKLPLCQHLYVPLTLYAFYLLGMKCHPGNVMYRQIPLDSEERRVIHLEERLLGAGS